MAQESTHDETAATEAVAAAHDADAPGTAVFRGTTDASTLEHYPRTFYGIADRLRVKVTQHGVYTCAVDSKNVIMARVFLPPAAFDDYVVTATGQFGLNTGDFYDIARFGSSDVRLEVNDVQGLGDDGEPTFIVNDGETFAGVPTVLDPDTIRRPPEVPDIPFTFDFTAANANAFREFAKAHTGSDSSTHIWVTASLDLKDSERATVTFANDETDVDPLVLTGDELAEWDYSGTDDVEKFRDADLEDEVEAAHENGVVVARSLYSVDYLKDAMKRVRKGDVADEPLQVKFGAEWPMKFRQSFDGGGFREWLLAPRISAD